MATTAIVPNPVTTIPLPGWLQKVRSDYSSKVAHVFILHGNIHDFPDNTGNNQPVWRTMASIFDTNIRVDMLAGAEDSEKKMGRGLQDANEESGETDKVMCRFTKN